MRTTRLIIAVAFAYPLAAAAQDTPLPSVMKAMGRGDWRMEILADSREKPGTDRPPMLFCTDNVLKARHHHAALGDPKCNQRLLKDQPEEAVVTMTCPDWQVTTTMRREGKTALLADVESVGKHPMTMKVRYTRLGACRPGQQAGMRFEPDSEYCKQKRESVAGLDPKRMCAGQGANQAQCEEGMNRNIAMAMANCR